MNDIFSVKRLESMSPSGYMRLIREHDGDICIGIGVDDGRGKICQVAAAEFCTHQGGGGSPATYAALIQLMRAMAEDNLDVLNSSNRRDECCDDEMMREIIEWAKGTVEASNEIDRYSVVRATEHLMQMIQAAKHLILAATGPDGGPTSWNETRDRWMEHVKELENDF